MNECYCPDKFLTHYTGKIVSENGCNTVWDRLECDLCRIATIYYIKVIRKQNGELTDIQFVTSYQSKISL